MINFLKEKETITEESGVSDDIILSSGWNQTESNSVSKFKWTSLDTYITINSDIYKELIIRYNGGPQDLESRKLTLSTKKGFGRQFTINPKLDVQIAKINISSKCSINISVSKQIDTLGKDDRILGIKVYSIILINKDNTETEYSIDKIKSEEEYTNSLENVKSELNNSLYEIADINVSFNKNGILYFGQFGTCGYAHAAKGYLYDFYNNNIPVSWFPLFFENEVKLKSNTVYDIITNSLINKEIKNISTVILHSTPDLWYEFIYRYKLKQKNVKIIGFMVWESDTLPDEWIECINDSVDVLQCPSTYNKENFIKNGVKIPIEVKPHIFLKSELPDKNEVAIKLHDKSILIDDKYTFYNISEYTERKSIDELIHSFCKTFRKTDNVRLILKLHYKDYSSKNIKYCNDRIESILRDYKSIPEIKIIYNRLSDEEILGMHSLGDCYVSLTKSEGFGLTIFDAYNYGNKVITTGYSGHIDFLGKDYEGLVKYKIGPVKNMEEFSSNYTENQNWAYPDVDHASMLMKKVYSEYVDSNKVDNDDIK